MIEGLGLGLVKSMQKEPKLAYSEILSGVKAIPHSSLNESKRDFN